MRLVGTAEDLADPIGKLVSSEQTVGLDHLLSLAPWIHFGSMAFSHGLRLGREGSLRS